jgi:hypothetical protein
LGTVENPNNVYRVRLNLIEDNVLTEAFDGVLTYLGECWSHEAAELADRRQVGNALKGSLGSIEKAMVKDRPSGPTPASRLSRLM